MKQSVLIVGVGGQGTLLAGRLLGEYAKAKGLDAKVSEVHGMAQRGGSVVTHVRIGENVASPLIDVQSADVLLSFEPVEALRALEMLKPGGMLICDESQVPPIAVNMGTAAYPQDVKEQVATYTDRYIFVDATGIARELGSTKAANIVLLGVYTQCMGMDAETMKQVIREGVKPAFVELNLKAFQAGLEQAKLS